MIHQDNRNIGRGVWKVSKSIEKEKNIQTDLFTIAFI